MAGAGYKLFNTGDVLTAAQVNTYLQEQTVMVFANSTARTTALSGVLAEGMVSYLQDTNAVEVYNGSAWVGVSGAGDVTEVQAGTGISVASGTGPIPVVTNTMATAVDAKGDLIVGTGADTFARLAVGTNGYTLVADSSVSPTGLKWAAPAGGGSLTLLSTTTLNSGTTTQTISSISGSYTNLLVIIKNMRQNSDGASWFMRINSDTGSNYLQGYTGQYWAGSSNGADLRTSIYLGSRNSSSTTWSKQGYGVVEISNYAASGQIPVQLRVINHDGGGGANTLWYTESLTIYNASAAITSITLGADNNFTSGTVLIYGVN